MKLDPRAIEKNGFLNELKPYRPNDILGFFVLFPIWAGIAWAFPLGPLLGTSTTFYCRLQGLVICLLLSAIICAISFVFSERGLTNHRFGGFKLYLSWFQQNFRGYLLLCSKNHDGSLTLEIVPRWRKQPFGTVQGHTIWISLDSWLRRTGGVIYEGFGKTTPSLRFTLQDISPASVDVLMKQSNGSSAIVSLQHGLLFAEADGDCAGSGLPKGPPTIEQALINYFTLLERAAGTSTTVH